MHIFAQEPVDFWPSQDFLCALPCPPIVVSWEGRRTPDIYLLGSNDIMDANGVKADHDALQLQAAYPDAYQTEYQPQTSNFTGGADYQTALFHPDGLPGLPVPYKDSWRYANGTSTMPTDSAHHMGQTGFYTPNGTTTSFSSALTTTGGSFSSTHDAGSSFSSTFSSSFGDTLAVTEAFPPRAFYNSTPIDTFDGSNGRVQELSSSPQSPENYFAPSYSMSSSSASSPAAMDSDAGHPSSAPVTRRPSNKNLSRGRRKLPDKQPRGLHSRRKSSPPPKPTVIRRGRSTAASSSSSTTPRHSRNTRSNSNLLTSSSGPHGNQQQLNLHRPPEHPRPRHQAQLRPATYIQHAPRSQLAIGAPPVLPPSSTPAAVPITEENAHMSEKDRLLIHLKEQGMGYKDIQKTGGFTEAVSTLRGRYRTLTKPREARVRKPAWSACDLRLLEQAVRAYTHDSSSSSSDLRTAKIPWMRVAAYIADNGGYHFGNSTCRKRWDELYAAEVAAGKDPMRPFFEQWAAHGGGR
ncbi:hypothetical protein GE09DRAFT_1196016 [Coniochaeta sp. 2T2.1]|nr:hypothetical protein GE09DRAFT_1196016 [Coniochaeta sp. 2T2.1]